MKEYCDRNGIKNINIEWEEDKEYMEMIGLKY